MPQTLRPSVQKLWMDLFLTGFLLSQLLAKLTSGFKEPFDAATATTLSLEVPLVGSPEDGADGEGWLLGWVQCRRRGGLASGVGSVGRPVIGRFIKILGAGLRFLRFQLKRIGALTPYTKPASWANCCDFELLSLLLYPYFAGILNFITFNGTYIKFFDKFPKI